MTTPAPTRLPNTPQPAAAKLKLLPFAFPFLRKGQGQSAASAQLTDEHDVYRLLAGHEQGGAYLVSRQGVWHGGIHVTEAGVGQSIDLEAGVRCLADGVLVAFRANQTYPASELKAADGTTSQAAYSTGFALVQHEMEFPGGSKLKFYSLYMHLMGNADYDQNFPKRQKPSYWSRRWTITNYAQDRPSPRAGQTADGQIGLNVRKAPNGQIIGIVPQGASVTIGRQEKGWGQVTDLQGGALYPPEAGGWADPASAAGGWIYLGAQNGGRVAKESIPDTMFDRVIVATDPACTKAGPQGRGGGIPVKAGDLIGHLGCYDPVGGNTTGGRCAHIEVFCDDSIVQFLAQGRDWIRQNSPFKARWEALGLPSVPTILRIAPGTVLYQRTPDNRFIPGPEPHLNTAGVVQVHSFAELARNKDNQYTEPNEDPLFKRRANWWQVESANALGHAIKGWVRDANHPGGGRVTREFAQAWIDFNALPADAHDTAHTIFATTQQWLDYRTRANAPDLADRSKLSPLMQKVYDALFTTGNGKQAADELSALAQTESGGYPWLMQAASRLIVKHESEWSNPSKWQQLYSALGEKADPQSKALLDADQKRIPELVWWNEVQAGVAGLPGPDVYHINPIGLVGNFIESCDCAARFKKISKIILRHEGGYVNRSDDKGGPTNHGIAWATWQKYAQEDVGAAPTLDNLKNLTEQQAEVIYLKRYWQPKGFCELKDERVALMVYDWSITSGGAALQIQKLLNQKYHSNIVEDSGMGKQTVDAINTIPDQEALLQDIASIRRQYYTNLTIKDPGQIGNLKGWLNRVNDCLQVQV